MNYSTDSDENAKASDMPDKDLPKNTKFVYWR